MRRSLALTTVGVVVLTTVGVGGSAQAASAATGRTTPGRTTAVHATDITVHGLRLTWRNPGPRHFARTEIRVARGTHAPRNVHEGRRVAFVPARRHTLSVAELAGGSVYSFAVFAADAHGHRARPAVVRATTVLDAPNTVRAYDTGASTTIAWRNPTSAQLRRVVVRYARGAAAPTSPRAGTGARPTGATAAKAVLTGLAPEAGYSISVFAIDRAGRASAPGVVRFTTKPHGAAPAPRPGLYSGRVVDSAGTPLIGADVVAERYTADGSDRAATTTAADGTFTLSLAPGDWYIGAAGDHAAGGNSDRTGYVYDYETVTITSGASVSDASLVLSPGALLTGRIVDASGRPIEGATPYLGYLQPYVEAYGNFFGVVGFDDSGFEQTGPDGTWTIRGIEPGYAFQLCSRARDARVPGVTGVGNYLNRCSTRSTVLASGTSTTAPDLALTQASASQSGIVTGHVRGADRHPLAALVSLVPAPGNTQGRGGYTESDAKGDFRIDGIAPGAYRICASPGPASGGARSGYLEGCSTTTVTVSAGRTSRAYSVLRVGAAVGGRITGPDGRNLAGVRVSLETTYRDDGGDDGGDDGDIGIDDGDDDGGDDGGEVTAVSYVTTDAQGRWTATGLTAGDYHVCYDNGDSIGTPTGVRATCWRGPEKVSLVAGRVRTGIDKSLLPAGAIAGTVTDASGRPLPYESVATGSEDDDDTVRTLTDKDGHYVLRGLSAGAHPVCYDTSDFDRAGVQGCLARKPAVRLGHVTGGVDVRLPAVTAIGVRVVDADGVPVAAVDAVAMAPCSASGETEDPDDCESNPVLGDKIGVDIRASRLTDGAGAAVLDGLAPGKHAVCLFAFYGTTVSGGSPTGYADACHGGKAFDVTVARGRTTAITMVLQRGGSVSGRVTDPAGHPLANARLVVDGSAADDYTDGYDGDPDDSPNSADGTTPGSGSLTAMDGTFTVIGVRPGARTVCVVPPIGGVNGYVPQCQGARSGTTAGATPVTVTAGRDTGDVDLRVAKGSVLTGRVTAGGRPLAGVTLLVFTGRTFDEDDVDYTQSASDGRWTVGRLPAGSYTVCAADKSVDGLCWHFVSWDYDQNPPLTRATLIPVGAGATRGGIDFAVRRR